MEDVNYGASWDIKDYNYVHKLFQTIQVADDYGEEDIVNAFLGVTSAK